MNVLMLADTFGGERLDPVHHLAARVEPLADGALR